jgi:hypothetical protein
MADQLIGHAESLMERSRGKQTIIQGELGIKSG